jgi:hypothetical protein
MGNEFVAKKGLTSLGNVNVSGSLTALLLTGSLTGSTFGTASSAVTSSYSFFAQSSPATTLFTASTYPITSSNSITASYSTFAQIFPAVLPTGSTQNITSSWSNNVSSSNIIGAILTSSYATFAQTFPAVLPTGSTQNITASWSTNAVSAQSSTSASYSTFAQTFPAVLPSGSTQNITASWAVNSNSGSAITSSANTTMYLDFSNTGSGLSPTYTNLNLTYNPATGSLWSTILSGSQITGSHFGTSSNAVSASYSTFAQTFPAALPTGSTQNITASWANNVSSSNIVGAILTSSYATFAQTFPAVLPTGSTQNITASVALVAIAGGTQLATGSTVPVTSSWAINASSGSAITSSANVTMYIDFSNTGSGLSPTYTNLNLTYNPATGSLWSTILSGSQVSASRIFSTASFADTASVAKTASFAGNYIKKAGDTFNGIIEAVTGGGVQLDNSSQGILFQGNGDGPFTNATSVQLIIAADGESLSIAGASGSVIISGSIASGSLWKGNASGSNSVGTSFFGTASYAINSVNAPGGSGTTLFTGSTYDITSSWANNTVQCTIAILSLNSLAANTSSYAITASFLSGSSGASSPYQPIVGFVTSSTSWITCSFDTPNQFVEFKNTAVYNFTSSNHPTSGSCAEILLHISHSATGQTSSLSFPTGWKWLNTGGNSSSPTALTGSRDAFLWLRAEHSQSVYASLSY